MGYIAFFQEEQTLIDWVNCQKLLNPFSCLGDGHAGIWKLFKQIGEPVKRVEILDWYHLKENRAYCSRLFKEDKKS